MTNFTFISRLLAVTLASGALVACGGDGGSTDRTGTLKLGITDAPVDHAQDVVVEFSGVELKPKGGPAFLVEFKDTQNPPQPTTKEIHLLDYQGESRAMLLDGEKIPAGEYEWMRLQVNAEPNVVDSYIVLDEGGGQCELQIPSGAETGLKMIRGFTVAAGGITDLTIDFDLRKSIVEPPGQQTGEPLVCDGQAYVLKPVLRVVDNLEVGTIAGTVATDLVTAACTAEQLNLQKAGRVYLYGPYAETDPVPAGVPDDYDLNAGDGPDPLDSALVDSTTGAYSFGFVQAGKKYVLAYTCDEDSTELDEALAFTPPTPDEPAVVAVNTTTTVDFLPVP